MISTRSLCIALHPLDDFSWRRERSPRSKGGAGISRSSMQFSRFCRRNHDPSLSGSGANGSLVPG